MKVFGRKLQRIYFMSTFTFLMGFVFLFLHRHVCIRSACVHTSQEDIQRSGFVMKTYELRNINLRNYTHFLNNDSFKNDSQIKKYSLSFQNVLQRNLQVDLPNNMHMSDHKILSDLNKRFFSIPQNVPGINCSALFGGDAQEVGKARKLLSTRRATVTSGYYINVTKECTKFKQSRRYITNALTKEEEDFPVAFSIVVFKDVEQTERLLRAIYRPQHLFCIHVDIKAKSDFRQAVKSIANCFENVFLSSRSVDVKWGTFSVLEADLICMKDLWKYRQWKYFINLTGQEFPLRSNYELMRILTVYKGANDIEGTIKRANKVRWIKAGKPPHGIRPSKGSVHITVNRHYVDYVLHNKTAQDILEWTKLTHVPDETFFSTLNHNPQLGIPGSYKGDPETDKVNKPFLTRFKNWKGGVLFEWPCKGKYVRNICVFGVGDLPLLASRPEMFANKFYLDYEPLALDCMEELIYNRTRDEYLHKKTFDTSFYESVDFITNKV